MIRFPAPRSLTGQIAALIAAALFIAQAINFALIVNERRALRIEQTTRPAVVRLIDASERADGDTAVVAANAVGLRRVTLAETNPVPANAPRVPAVERAIAEALDEAGIKHRQILTAIRDLSPDDPRFRHVAAIHARHMRLMRGELLIAAQRPDGRWLMLSAPWPHDFPRVVMRLIAQTLIIYAIMLLPVLWLGRRLSRPLRELTVAARSFGRADPVSPPEPTGPEDVRALVLAFTGLRDRVGAMLDEKDRMLGAIGHDLRTPLAALRVRIESVEDAGDRERMAATIVDMNRTLDDILSLARIGRPSEPATEVDIGALVEAVAADFHDLGQPVAVTDAPRVVRRLRPALMRRAIRNLIENAVKYGGGAEVSVVQEAHAARIVVADHGPGIPPERIAEAFESFTRLEPSRNRESGGVGLGLALARGIVSEAGGTLTLANRPGGGLIAEIALPA